MQEMNEEVRANTIAKVAKLIALANDEGATKAESELAMKRAEQIMQKYHIAMTEVMSKRKKKNLSVEDMTTREDADCYFFSRGYSDWELFLGAGIAATFNVEAVHTQDWVNFEQFHKLAFMGVPEDVALVVYFFDYCQNEFVRASEIYDKMITVQNNFARGMVDRILFRLETLYKRVERTMSAECTDIVLYSKDLAASRKQKEFPDCRIYYGRKKKFDQHYENGVDAGDRVHLSSNRDQIR